MQVKKITIEFDDVLFESEHHTETETRTLTYEVQSGILHGESSDLSTFTVRLHPGLTPNELWEVIKNDYPFI